MAKKDVDKGADKNTTKSNDGKSEALKLAIAQITKQFGDGSIMSGLNKKTTKSNTDDFEKNKNQCVNYIEYAEKKINEATVSNDGTGWSSAYDFVKGAERAAKKFLDKVPDAWPDGINSSVLCKQEEGNPKTCTVGGDITLDSGKTKVKSSMADLKTMCENATSSDKEDKTDKNKKIGMGVGGAIGAIGGAALGYHITDSILDAQLDKVEQEAIKEFMDNVGSKIRCFIGGEEVGNYGQVISTSME